LFQPEGPELSMMEMKKLQEDHFKAIKSSDAIYVINPDGYIGTMVTAEIGYALGQNKAVFYSEKTGKIEMDALASGITSLDKLQELGKTSKKS
jgi:nucleoside 2-deoxyribosyltransferase